MPIRVVTPTNDLPVAIALALRHLRALQNDADLVELYVQAATEVVEDYTARSLITKNFVLEQPTFDKGAPIQLKRTPVISVESVKYYIDNVLTTLSPTSYRVDITSVPARIVFVDDVDLPDFDTRHDSIQVQFTAGYGSKPSDVDARLRLAVLEFAYHCFENRIPVGDIRLTPLPFSLRHILRSMRV